MKPDQTRLLDFDRGSFRKLRLALRAFATSAVLLACGADSKETTSGPDTSSHWLASCVKDDDCGGHFECVCGTCTSACESNADCSSLDQRATCETASDCSDVVGAVCALACNRDSDCTENAQCSDGNCVAREPELSTDASAGDDPSNADDSSNSDDSSDVDDPNSADDSSNSDVDTEPTDDPTATDMPREGGADASGDVPSVPLTNDECAALVAQSRDGEPLCLATDEQCAQVVQEDRARLFTLRVEDTRLDENGDDVPFTIAEMAIRVACVVQWVSDQSLYPTADAGGDSVQVVARHDELQPLLSSPILMGYAPSCELGCEYCFELSENECASDAFCSSHHARRVDEAGACLEPLAFAACGSSSVACDDAESFATGPSGDTFWFASICNLPGFDYDVSSDASAVSTDCVPPDPSCFSPTQNSDQVLAPDASGCSCQTDTGVCLRVDVDEQTVNAALSCIDGAWATVEDGACTPVSAPCDQLTDILEACMQTHLICVERVSGSFCGHDPRGGYRTKLTNEQCEDIDGVVSIDACTAGTSLLAGLPDDAHCCVSELTEPRCEALGAVAVADPGTGGLISCPDDGAPLGWITGFIEGGLCCMPQ